MGQQVATGEVVQKSDGIDQAALSTVMLTAGIALYSL
jgi:hypothetical protein